MEKVYTVEEAAEFLRLSCTQVYRLIDAGKLMARNIGMSDPNKKARKIYRITNSDIESFLSNSNIPNGQQG